MRVIAGQAKGRRLRSAPEGTRPTTDRVKEALFSTLGSVAGRHVLDLYAGSGALGIEALSRGAERAVFVDRAPAAAAAVRANLDATGLAGRAAVVARRVEDYLRLPPDGRFDLVFADPPYAAGVPEAALELLAAGGWLDDGARIVLEMSSRAEDRSVPAGYEVVDDRRYGDSRLVYIVSSNG